MLITEPLPRLRISGTQTRMPRQTLVRLVLMVVFQPASSISSTTPPSARAALLTRMSMPPNALIATAAIASMSLNFVTSVWTNVALPPVAAIAAAAASPAWSSISATTTAAPSPAIASAAARPIPIAAPVTIATRPASSLPGMIIVPREPGDRQTWSPFHRAGGQAGDELALQNEEDRDHRYRDQHRARHKLAVADAVLADEVVHADRQRAHLLRRREGEREQKLLPGD